MQRSGNSFARRLWRTCAASLLLLLLGALATPIVQAQDPESGLPPCCRMMAGHMGCSMQMHRAMVHQMVQEFDHSHQFASLQGRCPCTPIIQSNTAPHDTSLAETSAGLASLPQARAPAAVSHQTKTSHPSSSEDSRGPPTLLTA